MPEIFPFKATRPSRETVSLVNSRNYESYNQDELALNLKCNPFSFLHIVHPGYKSDEKLVGEQRFQPVRRKFEEFKQEHILKRDAKAAFYIHQIIYKNQQQFTGIIGACHAEDYLTDKIKKHEKTMQSRVKLFTDYLDTVRFNADPVLISHEKSEHLNRLIAEKMKCRPEYEFATASREVHYLWVVYDEKDQKQIQHCFTNMKSFYIADGHHRIASSVKLAVSAKKEAKTYTGKEDFNLIMSYFIPEDQLYIGEFDRLVTDLNALDKKAFLTRLGEFFTVENRGEEYYKPQAPHQFSMYLDSEFYLLHLKKRKLSSDNALDEVNSHILYKIILKPILGIEQETNNDRIKHIQGQKNMTRVKSSIDKGKFAVGFGMMPTSIETIKHIAEQSLCMPPKSTFIDPKLRSGVTIHEF